MSSWQIALLVAAIVLMDLVIVGAVLWAVGGSLRQIAAQHPLAPPLPGAVRREFQSIRIGLLNLGFCVHITVDHRHMHIAPSLFMRVLRLPGASIPWESFTGVKRKNKSYAQARLGRTDVLLPLWAMRVGFPDIASAAKP